MTWKPSPTPRPRSQTPRVEVHRRTVKPGRVQLVTLAGKVIANVERLGPVGSRGPWTWDLLTSVKWTHPVPWNLQSGKTGTVTEAQAIVHGICREYVPR